MEIDLFQAIDEARKLTSEPHDIEGWAQLRHELERVHRAITDRESHDVPGYQERGADVLDREALPDEDTQRRLLANLQALQDHPDEQRVEDALAALRGLGIRSNG